MAWHFALEPSSNKASASIEFQMCIKPVGVGRPPRQSQGNSKATARHLAVPALGIRPNNFGLKWWLYRLHVLRLRWCRLVPSVLHSVLKLVVSSPGPRERFVAVAHWLIPGSGKRGRISLFRYLGFSEGHQQKRVWWFWKLLVWFNLVKIQFKFRVFHCRKQTSSWSMW